MTNKTGRPSFQIHGARLKEHRKQANLTQAALSERLFAMATYRDVESMKRSYGRIERTGQTSREMAMRLAEVLAPLLKRNADQLLAEWRGGAMEPPPDRIKEIESRLHEQLQSGCNTALSLALQRYRQSDQPDEDHICIEELARDTAFRLETAQLEQRHDELASVAELTGWTVDELLRPSSLHGHWLLITNVLVQREPATRETEILMGLSQVLHQIEKHGTEWLSKHTESDTRVELSEDAPWFRVTLSVSHWPFRLEFSFVRCAPSATGLQWVKPSEWDRGELIGDEWSASALKTWAFQHANFVKGSRPGECWPGDLSRLCLVVQQWSNPAYRAATGNQQLWRMVTTYKGALGKEPDDQNDQRNVLRAEGSEHWLVTEWLVSGLWEQVLAPLLSPIPADWWRITSSGTCIQINTECPSFRQAAEYGLELDGRSYEIRLMEETASGELHSAPWRQKDVQALAERLQKDLKACQQQTAIGPRRSAWLKAA